jgi:quinol monooxygenase YgiN
MIVVAGHIQTDPAHVEALYEALCALRPATLEEEGCVDYHFAIDDRAKGTILAYERWANQESLTNHLSTPHVGKLLESWGDKVSMEVTKFDAVNARGLMD